MLPPKIGDGVLGSSSGGVKPTGASFVGVSVFPSAMALMVLVRGALCFSGLTENDDDCFHGAEDLVVEKLAGAKREA